MIILIETYFLSISISKFQGDGIGLESSEEILAKVKNAGWSGDNLVLGCGGGLLQKHNRDTLKFAFKCSLAVVNDETVGFQSFKRPKELLFQIEVFKAPIEDAVKKSKKGKLALLKTKEGYSTFEHAQCDQKLAASCVLKTVFEDGKLKMEFNLDEIRKRADSPL